MSNGRWIIKLEDHLMDLAVQLISIADPLNEISYTGLTAES